MTSSPSKSLLRSMLIIGSAQAANVLISVLRLKIVAVLLGPAGVAVLAVYNNLVSTTATIAGLGIGSSSVREIAAAKGQQEKLSRVRVVLFWANLFQGTLALLAVWVLRERLAVWTTGGPTRSGEIGLVGIAVLLSLIAASQTALLQGTRRIGDLGRVTVGAAIAGTVAGLLAVWANGESGLIWFALMQPLAAVSVALVYTRRLPGAGITQYSVREIWSIWRPMAALGSVFMLGGLATTGTLLIVRSRVTQQLGLDGAGLFAASWGITMQYIGFLLAAMAADYYPRLSEVVHNRRETNQLVNDQLQICLVVGAPILIALIGLAPWAMALLYSQKFLPAAEVLQWQIVGNIFKLASWPIGWIFIAAGRSRLFLSTEIAWNGIFLLIVWVGLPVIGLVATGAAFLVAYAIHLILLAIISRSFFDFRWQSNSVWLVSVHSAVALFLLLCAGEFPLSVGLIGMLWAFISGVVGGRIILKEVESNGRAMSLVRSFYGAIRWPLVQRRD